MEHQPSKLRLDELAIKYVMLQQERPKRASLPWDSDPSSYNVHMGKEQRLYHELTATSVYEGEQAIKRARETLKLLAMETGDPDD